MDLLEFKSKEWIRQYGIDVPEGIVIGDAKDVVTLSDRFPLAAKVQIRAGGRGKAGGVKVCHDVTTAEAFCKQWLGKRIVTKQTDVTGEWVHQVYMEKAVTAQREFYLSIVIDRDKKCPVLLFSKWGGVEVESKGGEMYQLPLDLFLGIRQFHVTSVLKGLGLEESQRYNVEKTLQGLWSMFLDIDATLIEINPLALTDSGALMALDAKVSIDDSARFRQQALFEKAPVSESLQVKEAEAIGVSYVKLDGNIGCLVNGAGLAMATMDAIASAGGTCANFLDVGGSATEEKVQKAIGLLLEDTQVKGIFINIFGGIMQCDTIVGALLKAVDAYRIHMPIVIRLEGANKNEALDQLRKAKVSLNWENTLDGAVDKIVALVEGRS